MQLTEYRGFQINVTEFGRFTARYGDGNGDYYGDDSLDALKEQIDRHLNKQAKSRKLSLPVVLGDGQKATITGIHLSRGTLTGIPDHAHDVYPDVDWIITNLDRIKQLRQEISRLQTQIHPYRVGGGYRAARGTSATDAYAEHLANLEQDYAAKRAAALADENAEVNE